MAHPVISDETRQAIIEDALAGLPVRQIARKHGIGTGSVSRITSGRSLPKPARRSTERVPPRSMFRPGPEAAIKARQDYTMERRREVMNRLLDRCMDKLEDEYVSAQELRYLAISVAVMVDKLRLEEGEPVGREEHIVRGSSSLDELTGRIVSLAERRRTS